MEARKFMSYLNCIQSLEARDILNSISSTVYPHLKQSRMREQLRKFKFLVKNIIQPENKELASFSNVMDRIKVTKNV